jgi:Leucine-rich repeat (LRR) protein
MMIKPCKNKQMMRENKPASFIPVLGSCLLLALALNSSADAPPEITSIHVRERHVTIAWEATLDAAIVESFALTPNGPTNRLCRAATRGQPSTNLSFATDESATAFFRIIPGQDVPDLPDWKLIEAAGRSIATNAAKKEPANVVYADEMPLVTHLDARGTGVQDLSGIDQFSNLVGLDLRNNPFIANLELLGALTNLTSLGLADNDLAADDVHDILSALTSLHSLEIYNNRLENIKFLANLPLLTYLNMRGNPLDDLDPLSNLTNLEHLCLGSSHITSLAHINHGVGLQRLELFDVSAITSLNELTSLPNLYRLNAEYMTNLVDISSVTNMPALEYLAVNDTALSDISCLAAMTNLTAITLERNRITDIQPLLDNAAAGGLGSRPHDFVSLKGNPLSPNARTNQAPALVQAGVTVQID